MKIKNTSKDALVLFALMKTGRGKSIMKSKKALRAILTFLY